MARLGPLRAMMLAILVLAAALAIAALSGNALGAKAHGPILINGNAGFTAANGVVAGSGTAANPFVIQGWAIDASASDGITVRNTTAPFVIRNVAVRSGGLTGNGVLLENVTAATVENATLSQDANGIVVRSSARVALKGNTVTQNTWDGITILGSANVTLTGNNVTYNRDGVYIQDSSSILLQGNAIWLNAQDGAFLTNTKNVDIQASTFSSNGWIGLHVTGATSLRVVVDLVFSNGRDGIAIDTASNVVVRSTTTFTNQGGGIRLYGVQNGTVTFNDLSSNRDSGIVVESSRDISISQNIISSSGYSGILAGTVSNLTTNGNWISNSNYGVSLLLVSHATLRFNNVTLSQGSAIYLTGSDNVTVQRTNATGNANGFAVESTVDATFRENVVAQNTRGMYLFRSARIGIAGNRFDSNVVQALDSGGPENRWDDGYPAGGNFWSNYRGPDRCTGPNQDVCYKPDGIGDVPYYLDSDSLDRYPLMRPPGSPDAAPVASFVIEPLTGNTSTTFTLDASRAYDIEDNATTLELRWDFDGDGVWDTLWTHDRRVDHVFSQPGDYLVRLEVRDSIGLTNATTRNLHVGVAAAARFVFPLDAFRTSVLLLAAAAVAIGAVSYYRRRRRRPVARRSWHLPRRSRP